MDLPPFHIILISFTSHENIYKKNSEIYMLLTKIKQIFAKKSVSTRARAIIRDG